MLEPPTDGRRRNMAAVRSKDTKPEMYVRRKVHRAGFRFRLHRRDLPGRPDLTLPKYRLTIFVHGCFWHGHECNKGKRPRKNTDYWGPKIDSNINRDKQSISALELRQWNVFIVRECTIEWDTVRLIRQLEELRFQAEQTSQ